MNRLDKTFVDPMIAKRNEDMECLKAEGYSIIQLGKYFNITKQGVSKILTKRRKNKELKD